VTHMSQHALGLWGDLGSQRQGIPGTVSLSHMCSRAGIHGPSGIPQSGIAQRRAREGRRGDGVSCSHSHWRTILIARMLAVLVPVLVLFAPLAKRAAELAEPPQEAATFASLIKALNAVADRLVHIARILELTVPSEIVLVHREARAVSAVGKIIRPVLVSLRFIRQHTWRTTSVRRVREAKACLMRAHRLHALATRRFLLQIFGRTAVGWPFAARGGAIRIITSSCQFVGSFSRG
jgi:hypothetical protein